MTAYKMKLNIWLIIRSYAEFDSSTQNASVLSGNIDENN